MPHSRFAFVPSLSLLCLWLLMGCGGGGGSSSGLGDPPEVASLSSLQQVNLGDALALVITDDSGAVVSSVALDDTDEATAKTAQDFDQAFLQPRTLYKVTGNGELIPVDLSDAAGESLRGLLSPIAALDMGRGWTLLTFGITFQYVVKVQGDDGDEYWDTRLQPYKQAYLVHTSTGAAYAADWASEALIYEDGGKGYLDFSQGDDSVAVIEGLTIYSNFGPTTVPQSRFAFDDAGRLYVIGSILIVDAEGVWQKRPRMFAVSTDQQDAATLTASVIQSPDIDVAIQRLTVSSDGTLLAYPSDTSYRILNLTDGSHWNANLIAGGANTQVLRGMDGALYAVLRRTLEFDFTSGSDGILYTAVDRLSLVEGDNRPQATFVSVLHDPRTGPTRDWVSALADLQALQQEEPEGEPDSPERQAWLEDFTERFEAVSEGFGGLGVGVLHTTSNVVSGRFLRHEAGNANAGFTDIDLATGRAATFSVADFGFSGSVQAVLSDESVFFFGPDAVLGVDRIVRWTPTASYSDAVQEVAIDVETFDVQRFRVLGPDTILFEALVLNPYENLSTGDRILAEADFAGAVEILDVIGADSPQILVMERINIGGFIVVDGSADDWPVSLRVLTDPAGDHRSSDDGDLRYFSTTSNASNRWYLLEVEGAFGETRLYMDLSPSQRIEVDKNGYFAWIQDGAEQELISVGGIGARAGGIIEMRLPMSLLQDPYELPYIATQVERLFGAISVTQASIDADAATAQVSLAMTHPVGPATVRIAIGNERQLLISDPQWQASQDDPLAAPEAYMVVIRDVSTLPVGDIVLSDIDGAVVLTDTGITASMDLSDLGLSEPYPETLTPTVESEAQVETLLVDEFSAGEGDA